jgi:hypothetical protein
VETVIRPTRLIAAFGLLFAVAYASSLVLLPKPDGRVLLGDALHHYVQLRSAVFDHDLHFQNEYLRLYGLRGGEPDTEWVYGSTPTGHVRNLMPVGPAILWAPAFLLTIVLVWVANLAGAGYPIDGYARLYQATAGITGVAAATVGVWLSARAASVLFGRQTAGWAALIVWLSTSAVYYSVISPTYSHAASLLAMGAFWYVFIATRDDAAVRRYALLGAFGGICALMRWQDATVLLVPAVDLLYRMGHGMRLGAAAVRGAASIAAAVMAFLPQMLVWRTLYGKLLAVPQGESFMRWTDPALLQVLLSDNHGLLTWTPVVAVCLAGLVLLAKRDGLVGTAAILVVLVSWYVNAAAADWWAGEAFGARRFVSCVPVFTLGLAALIDRWAPSQRTLVTVGAVAVGYTFLLLVQYQAFMHGLRHVVPYPRGGYGLWLARFAAPFDLLRWWWGAA